jgi:hypothetical protein
MTKNTKLAKLVSFMAALVMMFGSFPGRYNVTVARSETAADVTVDPCANGHTLKETPAQAATAAQDGSTAYWTCSECGKYFSDAEGRNEISANSWIIAGSAAQIAAEEEAARKAAEEEAARKAAEEEAARKAAEEEAARKAAEEEAARKAAEEEAARKAAEEEAARKAAEEEAARIAAEEAARKAAEEAALKAEQEAAQRAAEEEAASRAEEEAARKAAEEAQISEEINGEPAPELDKPEEENDDFDEFDDFDDFDDFGDDDDFIILDDWDAGTVSDELLDKFNNVSNYEEMEFNGTAEIKLKNEGYLRFGDEIKLEAKVQDVNLSYRLVWEANDDDERGWYTIASGEKYSYTLTADNLNREYRVVLFSCD